MLSLISPKSWSRPARAFWTCPLRLSQLGLCGRGPHACSAAPLESGVAQPRASVGRRHVTDLSGTVQRHSIWKAPTKAPIASSHRQPVTVLSGIPMPHANTMPGGARRARQRACSRAADPSGRRRRRRRARAHGASFQRWRTEVVGELVEAADAETRGGCRSEARRAGLVGCGRCVEGGRRAVALRGG